MMWERFHRSPAARQLPGSGLGLSIVADIVESHGGTVFAGNHPDGGAIVGFTLPVSPGQSPSAG
jgi:two-component system sensor histidine kinase MprB